MRRGFVEPRRLRAALVLSIAIVLAYGGSLANDFVFDDAIFSSRDARVRSLAGYARTFVEPLWGFEDAPGERGIHQYYRPLQLAPLAVSHVFFGGAPWPAHLINLLLHAVNALLVYEILFRLTAGSTAALLGAGLFALHPASSEAVLWVSDVAGLGACASVLAIVVVHASTLGAWRAPLLIAPLALVGMLFKESAMLAIATVALWDGLAQPRYGERSSPAVRGADYLSLLAALAVYVGLRIHALGAFLPGVEVLELTPREIFLSAFALLPEYVATFLWPLPLNMYHDFDPARSATDTRVVAGMAIAIAWLAAIVGLVRRRPNVAFGMAWAAVAVSPYLLARWPQLNVFAERYLYVPSIGVLAAVVVPVASRVERERGLAAGAAAVAVACGLIGLIAIDAARTTDWRTEESIYTDVLAQSERAELVRNNLALHYLETGRAAEGIEIQRELLAMNPGFRSGWHNLGLLLLSAGRRSEALDAFQRSAEREPRNPATALNLGYTYDLLGERVRAVEQYFRTIALAPRDARPWYNLAVIALEQGQTGNARTALAKVLELTPDDHAARALAERLDSATQSASASPEGTTLDRCLAGRAAAEEGRYAEAVAKLRTAAWLDERSPLPHHYLANVMYLTGRHRLAYYHQREALARAPDNELYRKNLRALEEGLAQ